MHGAVGTAWQVASGRLRGRAALVSANVLLTQRCNLRCVYCSSPSRRTPELTTREWSSIFDQLAALGCRRLTVLGGEPLLRSDLGELLGHAHALGLRTVVTSNGLLVPRRIEVLRGVETLVLSLDAPGPANDSVRGAGVFAAVEAAIDAAREHSIPVKLNAVLSAATAPHLDDLLEFCERRDLYLTVNIMRSGAPDLWNDAASIKDDDAAIRALCMRLADVSRTNCRLLFSPKTYRYAATWADFSVDRIARQDMDRGDPRATGGPRCHAGRAYLTIDADGAVYPCTLTVHRIAGGNAATEGVEVAWRRLHEHGCATCFSPCMVEQNYLHSLHPGVLAHFARRHLPRFA
jgi:MoaA/NifB/PqqE/SkfB family radical SAM enzyme